MTPAPGHASDATGNFGKWPWPPGQLSSSSSYGHGTSSRKVLRVNSPLARMFTPIVFAQLGVSLLAAILAWASVGSPIFVFSVTYPVPIFGASGMTMHHAVRDYRGHHLPAILHTVYLGHLHHNENR